MFDLYVFYPKSLNEELKDFKTKEQRSSRIRFIGQEELSVFDENGQVLLERPNKLALEDTGVGGILKHVYASTVLDSLKMNGIEYVVVQPLYNLHARLFSTEVLGRCIAGNLPAVAMIYEGDMTYPMSGTDFHLKGSHESYSFVSECVLSLKLITDQHVLAKFNISEALRTLTVNKEVIDIYSGNVTTAKVRALKIMLKDFLGCVDNIGLVISLCSKFEEFSTTSKIKRLSRPRLP